MKIQFPKEWKTDEWYGGLRHVFEIDGHAAWFVEPKNPVGDGRWTWCMIWPEAFVPRVGVPELLAQGFYHAHIDALTTYATPEGQKLLLKFYAKAQELGLAPKVNLIGMSWGGFFSLRFASENPDKVSCIYLDAPLCNMADRSTPAAAQRCEELKKNYGLTAKEMETSRFNPINALEPIVKAGIPIFAATGEGDTSVPVAMNINIVEKRFKELGGKISICRRNMWEHHPHGFDDRSELLSFMIDNAAEQLKLRLK